jgi:hypothetical protein
MNRQIQEQLQIRLKMLDDVFHNVIIALERLEIFLEQKRNAKVKTEQTAINTDGDLHDDKANPPTEETFHLEMHTQCLSLFFQTNFDRDKETFDKVVRFFLSDILTWYGGRKNTMPYNEVEQYFIPVISALSRQISNQRQISEIIKQYVIDIDTDIKQLSDERKERAVVEGFTAFTRATEVARKSNEGFFKKMLKGNSKSEFTSHTRGTETDGYERLLRAFLNIYTEKTPVLMLRKLIGQHFPDLDGVFEEIVLDEFYNQKK